MNSITAPSRRHNWKCSGCDNIAFGAGTYHSLVFLGWQVSDHGEVWCPDCHLLGEVHVQAQLDGTLMFILLSQRVSTEPEMADELRRLASGGKIYAKPEEETH